MKKIIIDFENEFIFIKSETYNLSNIKINQIQVIKLLDEINEDIYLKLCKASILGFNFENNEIIIYKPIIYNNKQKNYPLHMLQIKETININIENINQFIKQILIQ